MTLAAVVAGLASRPTPERPIVRFDILAPPQHSLREFSLSPDGVALAFGATDRQGTRRLWIRQLDATDMQALSGTEGAAFPFWSPDGRSIGFFASGKLKRIDVESETIQTLADAPNGRGGAWSSDDVILFTPEGRDGLYRVPASGGDVALVTQLADDEESHRMPHFLPDGRRFVYVAQAVGVERGVRVLGSLDSDESTELLEGISEAYAPPGYLLYVRELTLMAQRFDADALALQGQAVPLAKRVLDGFPVWGRASFAASNTGVLAYYQAWLRDSELVWFDRNGLRLKVVSPPGVYAVGNAPALSPDGRRVGFIRTDPSGLDIFAIWVLDLERGTSTRVTPYSQDFLSGAWSHDGESLFFSTGWSILRQRLSGAADPDTIWTAAAPGIGDPTLPSWVSAFEVARDGSFITFEGWNSQTDMDVWRMQLDGQRQVQPLAAGPHRQESVRISPNGRWIAYVSDESGRAEIYVRSASPGSAGKTLVSTTGGSDARWSRDGSALYYVAPDRQLMAVQARFAPTFEAGLPVALFDAPEGATDTFTPELLAVDGEHFLFNVPVPGAKPPSITVMLNWDQALSQ